jgi:hypothetical protein
MRVGEGEQIRDKEKIEKQLNIGCCFMVLEFGIFEQGLIVCDNIGSLIHRSALSRIASRLHRNIKVSVVLR